MKSPYGLDIIESCVTCDLRSNGFFCSLPPAALKAFEDINTNISYPRGAMLFSEGQEPRGIFVVCQGKVKLTVTSADGKTIILKLAQPGEVLGLNATMADQPYEVTAETVEPTQLGFVKRQAFLRFLEEHGVASMHAAQQLSSQCQIAYEQIRSLGLSQSAPEKLARLLLEWAQKGSPGPRGVRVRLTLTQEEIGQLIGSSRETVTRLFADFRRKGLVERKGSVLWIRNPQQLQKLVS
jgi:CRP/FNR family transcriptional regulator, cyclic AMP receptor protein